MASCQSNDRTLTPQYRPFISQGEKSFFMTVSMKVLCQSKFGGSIHSLFSLTGAVDSHHDRWGRASIH